MPYFLTCEECDKDYLCHDDFRREPDIEYQTVCPRCFDLYYRAAEEEKPTRGLQMRPNCRIRRQL